VANAAYLALLCSNSTRKSFRLNNSSGVELPPIMGSRKAVNARDEGVSQLPLEVERRFSGLIR